MHKAVLEDIDIEHRKHIVSPDTRHIFFGYEQGCSGTQIGKSASPTGRDTGNPTYQFVRSAAVHVPASRARAINRCAYKIGDPFVAVSRQNRLNIENGATS